MFPLKEEKTEGLQRIRTMVPNKTRVIRKFNPGVLQSDDEVVEQFVVRNHELKTVLALLQDNIGSPSCQHALIIAPRGQGKTMLLTRTAAELRSNEEFSQYLLPVRFIEESQEIFTMADFWLETLYHLAIECKRVDYLLAEELHKRHATLSKNWSNDTLEERAKIAVLDAADRIGRKLVLMVENLQSLNEAVDKDFGWELRYVLQSEPQIILLGSAISRFSGIDDATQPFFELFRIIRLQPLNADECLCLWNCLTGHDSSSRNIRPLEILTGGSPRLIVILASFARHMSIRRLLEELVLMIDEFTDYFRGNLESLANTERRVFIAVIDLWQPSTPSEISVRARMDIRKVSTMLGRLVERGAVISEGNGRKRKYSAAERLYSIYYKLRRNRDDASIVQTMIHFMSAFYTDAEQKKMFSVLISEMSESKAIQDGFRQVMSETPDMLEHFWDVNWVSLPNQLFPLANDQFRKRIQKLFDLRDFSKVIQSVDHVILADPDCIPQLRDSIISWDLMIKAAAERELGLIESALLTISEVVKRYGTSENNEVQLYVAHALLNKGEILRSQLNHDSALNTFEEVVRRLETSEIHESKVLTAKALVYKGELLHIQDRLGLSLAPCEEVVERYGSNDQIDLQFWVGQALINKGLFLQNRGRIEDSISTFEDVIQHFHDSKSETLLNFVGQALAFRGQSFMTHGRLEDALHDYDEVVRQFGSAKYPPLQYQVARALLYRGKLLRNDKRTELALSAFEELIKRFRSNEHESLKRIVARALIYKVELLLSQNNPKLAISACDELIQLFCTSEINDLLMMVSRAQLSKIKILCDSYENNYSSILSAAEDGIQVISTFQNLDLSAKLPMLLQLHLAEFMMRKAFALHHQGEILSCQTELDEIIERFGTETDHTVLQWSILASIYKSKTQIDQGNIEGAIFTSNVAIRRLHHNDFDRKGGLTWNVRLVQTEALLNKRDQNAAIESFRLLYASLEPNDERMIREIIDIVIHLFALREAPDELVQIISSGDEGEDALRPLIVALQIEAGQEVRAPVEILEIASDIRKNMKELRTSLTANPAGEP
ncbi:MAG: tetratricopeptide repeat protein [Rhodothermaceae bacterium]|nr:tetratricopeptide repeat protein [Rhodothermaceae bacterium]MYE63377.1 tetratricopeptide repeat protein [Rhodothermaceae bacterium]MYJ21226.1 tetratricopeptide repeat protein [Rhodothermaceae bacterium]